MRFLRTLIAEAEQMLLLRRRLVICASALYGRLFCPGRLSLMKYS